MYLLQIYHYPNRERFSKRLQPHPQHRRIRTPVAWEAWFVPYKPQIFIKLKTALQVVNHPPIRKWMEVQLKYWSEVLYSSLYLFFSLDWMFWQLWHLKSIECKFIRRWSAEKMCEDSIPFFGNFFLCYLNSNCPVTSIAAFRGLAL